jgi:hypothetical protein
MLQEPIIGSYSEPIESSPHSSNCKSKSILVLISHLHLRISDGFLPWIFRLKYRSQFLYLPSVLRVPFISFSSIPHYATFAILLVSRPRMEFSGTDLHISPLACLFHSSRLAILFTGMLAVTDGPFLATSSLNLLPSERVPEGKSRVGKRRKFQRCLPHIHETSICGHVKGLNIGCNTNAVLFNYLNHQ